MGIGRMVMIGVAVITLGGAAAFAQDDGPAQAGANEYAKSQTDSRGSGGGVSTANERRRAASNAAGGDSGTASSDAPTETAARQGSGAGEDGKARDANDALWEADKDCCP